MVLFEESGKRKGKMRRNFSDEEFKKICKLTDFIKDPTRKSIRERVYCIINCISSIPICPECGGECKFLNSGRYSTFCTKECSNKSEERIKNAKATKLERYGDENFNNQEKAKETTLLKYGVAHTSKLKENRRKAASTLEKLYGSANYNNIEKIKQTNLEKYGTDNPSKAKEIKDKISLNMCQSFSLRRSESGDLKGIVYIIHFQELKLVKIGVTSNKTNRYKTLRKEFGEFNIIKEFEVETCFKIERELHDMFSESRIVLHEGVGRTEFFDKSVLEMLQESDF